MTKKQLITKTSCVTRNVGVLVRKKVAVCVFQPKLKQYLIANTV